MRTPSRLALFALLPVAGVCADPAAAWQAGADRTAAFEGEVRRELGFGLLAAEPVGAFSRHVDGGTGFRLSALLDLGRAGGLGLRLDGTLVTYGRTSERRSLRLSGTVADVDVTTENTIASFAIGPQIVLARGPLRPYFGTSVGSAQFATTTAAWSGGRAVPIATAEALERHTLVLAAGGGLRLAIRERRRHPLTLELDGRYLRHGRVEYLPEGGIRELPDGTVALDPVVSNANLWTIHLGLVVGFR